MLDERDKAALRVFVALTGQSLEEVLDRPLYDNDEEREEAIQYSLGHFCPEDQCPLEINLYDVAEKLGLVKHR